MDDRRKNKEQLIREIEDLREQNQSLTLQIHGADIDGREIKLSGPEYDALQDIQKTYNDLMDHSQDVIFSLSPEGMLVSLNKAFENMTGWRAEQWIGKPFGDLLHPDDIALARRRFSELIMGEPPEVRELRFRKKSGDYIIGEILATPQIRNGAITGMLGIARDITGRKKAEEQLQQSEYKTRAIFDLSFGFIGLLTPQGIVLDINQTALDFAGIQLSEVKGKPFWETAWWSHSPEVRLQITEAIKAASRGELVQSETTHFGIDGRLHIIDFTLKPILNLEGEVIFLIPEGHDITERKKMEEALRESEDRFKTLSVIGTEGLMIHKDGIILDLNPAFAKLIGWENPNDLVGKNGPEVMPFTDESRTLIIDHMISNSEETFDVNIIGPDGKIIPAETRGSEILYKGVKARLVSMRDISERKKFENALAESEALLTSIIDSTNDLIWSISSDEFRLLTFNKGLEDFFNNAGIRIRKGMLLNEILPSDLVDKLSLLYTQTLKEGSLITMYQTTIGNRTLWINLHVLTSENKPFAISVFAKDISELMQAQEALIEAKKKAEESDRLKTAFMNNISHEVRTPLNGILGFGQLILEPDINEEEKRYYLDALNSSSERLINTITDYMDISLIVSGSINVKKQPFDLMAFLNGICDKFESKCRTKNLKLMRELLSEKKTITIDNDASLLEKSIYHLLDNALKFTEIGTIILGFRYSNSEYEIFVTDTGSGISNDAQHKIFDYFIQEVSSITRGYEGSGLGLSIVKGLVEIMGGKIKVESTKGRGSTFRIILPSEERKMPEAKYIETDHLSSLPESSPLVLLVDDDEISVAFHKTILNKASFNFLIAENGFEAIELCRNNQNITIVLMDLKMPVMDGFEATRKIRELRKDLPVIGVTAFAMTGDKEKALAAGCDDYITKPVQSEVLLSVLTKYQ